MLAAKRLSGVAPEGSLREPLRSDDEACKGVEPP